MKKRMLALVLALVLMVGMLPTVFATDAVEPAAVGEELDTENPAEGENEEMPEEPEETGAEEEAKAEAEAAPLAADASGTVAYLLGMRLENGYYTANKAEVGHYTEKPDSLKNYLFYEDGVLTVFGGIVAGNSGTEDWKAVLSVESGSLTIKGSGILKLNGAGMSGLYVDRNHADINIDLAEGDALGQISIKSTNACTVRGDLTVTNASFAEIATDIDRNADTTIICDTIDGGAWIHASTVSIYNRVGGSCVNGILRVRAEKLTVTSQGADKPTLNGDWNQLVVDRLTLTNAYGAVAVGGVSINVYSENKTGSYTISGCTPNGVPVIHGDVYAEGGRLSLGNRRTSADTYKSDGPVLIGNLKLENGTGLSVGRSMGKTDNAAEAMIQGNIELINCRIYSDNESHFTISRSRGDGAAVDGNITLRNSQLYVNAAYSKVLSSKPDSGAANQPTTGVRNCTLTLENSHFTFRGYSEWEDFVFDEDYQWYAGNYVQNVPAYKRSSDEQLTAEAFTNAYYVDIYTGDKAGKATVHDASFTEEKTIDGWASWPLSFDVTVQMTGDTLNLQKVDGYKELYDSYEKGEKITHYGVDSSVDLAEYFDIVAPGGYPWKITAVDFLEQGATELNLRISGTPEYVSDLYFFMDIRGKLLGSGHDLRVNDSKQITWNIRLMPSGELDYDNIRTAAEFAEAVGGADYAEVSETSSEVTLRRSVRLPRDITMTGNFTIDLNGFSVGSMSAKQDEEMILRSAKGEQKIISSGSPYGAVTTPLEVSGGTLQLENIEARKINVESGKLELDSADAETIFVNGGYAELNYATLIYYVRVTAGEVLCRSTWFERNSINDLVVSGGKVEICENSELPGTIAISNSMVYGYEEMWLSQTGGTVNVRNSELHNAAMLGGGEEVVTNTKVLANPTEPENGEESRIIHSSVHMDGGRLTLDNSPLFGSLVINAGAALELKNGSNVKTEAATAIMASGEVHITDCDVRGKEIEILMTGGKKASAMLHSGEVSGKEAGVLVDGGSFTMDGGTINGGKTGILVTGPKCRLTIKDGAVNAGEVALCVQKGSSIQLSGGTFTGDKNAIFAENGTMKGWLAKGYDMIGPNLPGGFDPAKESGTGAGTVMIVTEDGKPAQIVMDMIDEIGKVELTDECERKILDAEGAYEMLTAAQQKKVTNYKTLLKARQIYDKQVAEREYAEQAGYVNYLMEEIPADMEKIESSTLSVIREAEGAYNEAAKDKNVKKYLDNNLVKRLKTARKTYDKNEKAAGNVQEMIDDLPAPEELTYAKDRKSVTKAQTAFENLTAAQQTFLGDGTDRRLTACVRQMALLTDCETIVKDAQAAIKKLPAWNKIKKSDEAKVHAAEEAMQALASAAEEKHVTLTPGEANEQKYQASTEAFYAYKELAESYRKMYLAPLEDLTDADAAHKEAIEAARREHNALGRSYNGASVSKNVQSFITKDELTMLKNLEKQLSQNQKAAKKVTSLISKLPKHDAPFTKKERKAIDTAKSAYDGLSSAARSFVENVDTLNERYQQAYPATDSGEQA